jgi:hypothetical protein
MQASQVPGRVVKKASNALCALLMASSACLQVTAGGTVGQTSNSTVGTTGTASGSNSGGAPSCPPCPANATCNPDGTCSCHATYTDCPGLEGGRVCTQELLDRDNCGGCGNICPPGRSCLGGACTCVLTTCPSNDGGTVCTDTNSDPMNCGDCGRVCPISVECTLGGCGGPPTGCGCD